jgi:hypothetical protein
MNPIKGIVAVASSYGVGKTEFALGCGCQPKDMVFVNDDVKETGFEDDFKFYIDLVSASKKRKLLELHSHCLDLIKNLPESKVIIWDTWTQFQATFPVYVKSHLNEFRNPNEWAAMGRIKAGEIYQEAYRYEGAVLGELKQKCDLLILTFHLKQHYEGDHPVPDRFKPGHDKAVIKYSDMRIWLTPNLESQVPTGLILKNISKRQVTEQGIVPTQVLPPKLSRCNWPGIWEYWENPIGDRPLEEHERPTSYEFSLIKGTLTPEDRRLFEASLSLAEKQEAKDQAEQLLLRQSQEKVIKAYISDNLDGLVIPAKLNAVREAIESNELEYNGEITATEIKRLSS